MLHSHSLFNAMFIFIFVLDLLFWKFFVFAIFFFVFFVVFRIIITIMNVYSWETSEKWKYYWYVRTSTTSSSIKFELLRQHSLVGAFALNSTYYWMTKTLMKLNFNSRIINYISKKFYLRYILFVNFNL